MLKKYAEYIRSGKKYKPAEPVVNFSGINRALAKLERKELEAEALLESSLAKLKRLRR